MFLFRRQKRQRREFFKVVRSGRNISSALKLVL